MRYLFGLTGSAVTAEAMGATSGRTVADIITYLDSIKAQLDIDGNGTFDPLTDGLLIFRYMAGLRGDALIEGAIGGNNPTRFTAEDIENYLAGLMP
jgi:hypothetical protein